MTAIPADLLSAIVTILAIVLYFYMSIRVAQMRGKHKIDVPAITGHPEFERAFRVHYNTLEALVMFLPLLWLATIYFVLIGWLPALLGVVWIVGRIIYMNGYMAAPEKRSTGFGISTIALMALLILALYGIVEAFLVVSA